MKSLQRALLFSILATAPLAPACHSVSVPDWPYVTAAEDAGRSDDGAAVELDGGGGTSSMGTPLACDGALCDTTNYAACNIGDSPAEGRAARPISVLLVVGGMAFGRGRSRRRAARGVRRRRFMRGFMGAAAFLAVMTGARATFAQAPAAEATPPLPSPEAAWPLTPEGTVDVALHEQPPARRILALEFNPLSALAIHRWGANIIFAPFEHHALILNPFHAYARTYPINLFDDDGDPLRLPVQTFNGWGAELGYRYYAGRGGLRGLFLGPSLIADWMTAVAQDGSRTSYVYYGFAADVGYQVLINDRVSLSLGAGLQYARPDKDIPKQGLMAKYYANAVVLPRWLVSIGWAL